MEIVDLKEIPDAIPMLADWHHEQWSYLSPQTSLEIRIEKYHEYLREEIIPSAYVAIEKSAVMGSASIIKHDMKTRMEYSPWLASVYVHPEHRDQGIGSKLVSHAMSIAKKNNFEFLYLFTPDKEKLYQRLGWSTIHNELYSNTQVSVMAVRFS